MPPPLCYIAIPRAGSWCGHRRLASGQSGWGVYVCPGCHFNTGTPPSPTQVLEEIAQRQSEWRRGLGGRDNDSCLIVPHTALHPPPKLRPSLYLPGSDSQVQYKDPALGGRRPGSPAFQMRDFPIQSPPLNGDRTREAPCCKTQCTASSSGSHKPDWAPHPLFDP